MGVSVWMRDLKDRAESHVKTRQWIYETGESVVMVNCNGKVCLKAE